MRKLITILTPVILLFLVIPSNGQAAMPSSDAAAVLSSEIMQISSDMSSDIQQIIALTARGNQPITSKEAKVLVDQLNKDMDLLKKNAEKLLKAVRKSKKLTIIVRNMIAELKKSDELLSKFTYSVVKGNDSTVIKIGGSLRDLLFNTKKTAQEVRKDVNSPNSKI